MPEARIVWRKTQLNQRTVAMLIAAEKIYKSQFGFLQGSYNKGGVEASAGTHDGGGAVDIDVVKKSPAQRRAVVLALRQVGFAAWLRTPAQGRWPYHVHAIAIGDKDLSRGAATQVLEYKRKRNGLANRGKDDGPPGYYAMTWEIYLKAHPVPVPPAVPDSSISLAAMAYARTHDVMTGAWGADRARVIAWAAHPKVGAITKAETLPRAGVSWHLHFQRVIRKVQMKFQLPVTGIFNDGMATLMKRYGYTITA
ncbi:hypothetical protein [Streptomyces sp. SID13031]|uniref:hypothetical protein n=1 Tax=Streptomyces sp. SID13031 TaxID=2706046 RepID=UPI0013C8AEE3|nr:hypothetical protein [Streptomyces sp. SID13031]NEA35413.1 hypothetical protein [Streptomyces sp. SID13031]